MVTVETRGSRLMQYLACMTGCTAVFINGMFYGWPSPSLPQFKDNAACTLCIDESQGSTLAIMLLVGSIPGSLVADPIVDRLGRKLAILATTVPFLLAWIVVVFAEDILTLYIGRFVAGVAAGVSAATVPIYTSEVSDAKVRGMLGGWSVVSFNLGFLAVNVIGSYFSVKATAAVSSSVPAVLFVTFLWMPESPHFLLMRNKVEDARKALEVLKGCKEVGDELSRIRAGVQGQAEKNGRFLDLFTVPSNRKSLLIMGGLFGFQQLTGTVAIAFYTHEIFNVAGTDISNKYTVMIYYFVQLIANIVSSSIVDRTGRRPLLLISTAGAALALFVEAVYFYLLTETSVDTTSFSVVASVGLLMLVTMSGLGLQTIPLSMVGELFPTNVRASASSLTAIHYCLVVTAASKFLQITKVEYGLHVSFLGFFLCSVAGLIFFYCFVPETKGKSLEDIQKELREEVK